MARRGNTRRHGNDQVSIEIQKMITGLTPLSNSCCIFRVPERLRETNEKAYTPQVVSIGPLHRGKKRLQAMEEHKVRCLKSLFNSSNSGMNMERCVGEVKMLEKKARGCYAESIKLSSDKFVEMILLDGSFTIEVIRRYDTSLEDGTDYLNRHIRMNDLFQDMILIENQLPFFVLERLYKLLFHSTRRRKVQSFLKLSIAYFADAGIVSSNSTQLFSSSSKIKHFVDLLRSCHLPSSLRPKPHLKVKFVPIRNATDLQAAGMKFKKGSSNRLLDIKHDMKELKIPPLILCNWTEPLLRNLAALEQCQYPYDSYIIDYIYFMDKLIDSAEDVDLLIRNGIFENHLGDTSEVASLYNNLTKEVVFWCPNYYFSGMSEELNEYCKRRWPNWKALLKRDYFSTPWRATSTTAAIILLALTLIQTIYSVLSLYHK
ncbi:UPF0481 protein At3g47200-like [Cornus florida]|uniref:UPF0481 protein At3g47200-like n=1 Tax=Cornus florida TaxID=4283 RepID=UPI00289D8635|nr:UPF0481 protein At3g47200-like [Cornus florida]